MNGKSRDMDYKFAIKVLSSAKVDTPSTPGNPKRYGYQNQYFYDIARNMAIQALKEKHENTTCNVAPRSEVAKEIFVEIEKLLSVNSDGQATLYVTELYAIEKKFIKE